MSDEATVSTGRRRFLAGAAAGSAAAVAATVGIKDAEAKLGDMARTSITDTLMDSEISLLTPRARELNEMQVLLHNWALHGYGDSPVPDLTDSDMLSLERAFISRNRRLWGVDDYAALSPNMVNSAYASTSCCCCPASCCTASVDTKPVRTRRVIV